jgi:CheY-like chemotaxis protein
MTASCDQAFMQSPDLFHAVLLDVTLPTLDGLTVLERIREIRSDIRVVVSSGWSEEEVAARIGGRPGVRFLQKPYRAEALVEILQ